jgi:hypothetical protein
LLSWPKLILSIAPAFGFLGIPFAFRTVILPLLTPALRYLLDSASRAWQALSNP